VEALGEGFMLVLLVFALSDGLLKLHSGLTYI